MEKKIFNSKVSKLHFIGVGGVSTSALANYALSLDLKVSGSDITRNEFTERLEDKGAEISYNHDGKNVVGADAVIVTSAVGEDNEELKMAKNLKIPVFNRAEMLGEIVGGYKNSVAVSGSHGKTTATAMLSNILIAAGLDPTVFLGGTADGIGNYRKGNTEYAVVEACEYKRNMLYIKPRIAVVLNVDNDHLDCYGDIGGLIKAFREFTSGRIAVINADDDNSKTLFNSSTVTFGIDNLATYTARNLKYNGLGYDFTVCAYSRRIERIRLKVKGKHNVYNALAAFAAADILGVSSKVVKNALESFGGVKRRMEYLGNYSGLDCYADYAHHPKEIKATLLAIRESGLNPLVVFQPHTYSRTKLLMSEFEEVFNREDGLIIYKTYSAREKFDILGDAKTLRDNLILKGGNCDYADTEDELFEKIDGKIAEKNALLFLGAGNIYDLAANKIRGKI